MTDTPPWRWKARMARVYLDQTRACRTPEKRSFRCTLLDLAANKRRQALASIRNARMQPAPAIAVPQQLEWPL